MSLRENEQGAGLPSAPIGNHDTGFFLVDSLSRVNVAMNTTLNVDRRRFGADLQERKDLVKIQALGHGRAISHRVAAKSGRRTTVRSPG